MKIDRIKKIEQYMIEKEKASIEELCSLFKVSKNTIRRDINELEKYGKIKKVYGGIILKDKKITEPFESRKIKNKEAKQTIGRLASELVNDGDIIYVDSGTTTMHMIPYLSERKNLIIITNNLNVIIDSIPYPTLNVISIGGELRRRTNSFFNMEAIKFLENYNFSKAFMAATGISISKGVTNSSSFENDIKKYIVQNSNKVILLADNTKLDHASLITYYDLKDINVFVTNAAPPIKYKDFFRDHNIQLITPSC